MDLKQKHCIPCESGDPPLSEEKEDEMLKLIRQAQSLSESRRQVQHDKGSNWFLLRDQEHKLRRQFKFKTFKESIEFVNKVADIAESEGHHPDIYIFYNKVQLDLFTHAVGGLSENDFIMASKIDSIT